jgi:WD40 repeat protein/DNA-binding SARP family transcriptional activator
MLELRVLGQFEVRVNDAVAVLASRPAQSLLAYLALSAGRAHRREKLAGLFWPDADEDNARANLRHGLWRIRKTIEAQRTGPGYLVSDELAVAFDAGADYWLDADVLVAGGDAVHALQDSLDVYRGELLPGFYDDWVSPERERLAAVFQRKMQRLLDRLTDDRRWTDVLEWANRWVAVGHAPEPAYRALMHAHSELGNRSGVAMAYQHCRTALFHDLGVEPSPQTQRLFARLAAAEDASLTPVEGSEPDSGADHEGPAPGTPPFRGLQAFDVGDADLFFGREPLTTTLVRRLRTEAFLAVIGASGSGKSSVVRAGLVAALSRSDTVGSGSPMAGDQRCWDVHLLTPTAQPLAVLAKSLARKDAPESTRTTLLNELGRDPCGLQRFLSQARSTGRRALLVVDQFEEVFTVCHDEFEREAFIENVLAAAQLGAASVVIALRADFYPHCARYASLRQAIAQHQEFVGPMSPAELRRAIELPAARGSWSFEPGLVDLLLRDVGEEPGALPLLSHALLETWQRRRGRRLTLAGYAEAGGVDSSIARTADMVFAQRLTTAQQPIARRIFLRLTELGEGTQDTRRRARMSELVRSTDEEPAVCAVLEVLADARLITLGADAAEVAHEALIREWPMLRDWLNQDRENLRLHRRMADVAQEWERLEHDPGLLYRGAALAHALDWAADHRDELNPLERAFLETSTETSKREARDRQAQRQRELQTAQQLADAERRRADLERQTATQQRRSAATLRRRALFLAGSLAIALATAAAAVFFGDQAREQALRAQASGRVATARELAAAAISNASIDPERAALLALQAVTTTYAVDRTWTPEAEDALHRTVPSLRTELVLAGHTSEVMDVTFNSSGQRIATAGRDATARLWDAATGQEQGTLSGHAAAVNAIVFSPDDQLIATASDDSTAKIWDAATGVARLTLSTSGGAVDRVAFSTDGSRLATLNTNGAVTIWNAQTGGAMSSFGTNGPRPEDHAIDIVYTPGGDRLATVSLWGTIREWDLGGNPAPIQMPAKGAGPDQSQRPRGLAFSPDGERIVGVGNTAVSMWSAPTGTEMFTVAGHSNQIYAAAFSQDGGRFATGSMDRTAKVWDAATGHELLTLIGHRAPVRRVAFSPDGRRLATASTDGDARVWDLGPAREALALPTTEASRAPGRVSYNADGSRVMEGLSDATAWVWDAASGEHVLTLRGHTDRVVGTAFSRDGRHLATSSFDGTARLWDAASGEPLSVLTGHIGRVWGVAFSSDSARVASAGQDGTTRIWDVATGRELLRLPSGPAASVAFSPDGSRLAVGSLLEGQVGVWNPTSGELLLTLRGHKGAVWSVAYSADSERLVSVSGDGARAWDAFSGQQQLALPGPPGTDVGAAFSPDGRLIASVGREGVTKLWDAATGQELLALPGPGPEEGISGLAFSPDGRQLATGGDYAVRIYLVHLDDLISLARSRVTRSLTREECQRYLHLGQCPN